jgi:hypothetical protein
MSDVLPPKPYKTIEIDGRQTPWYIIPFDKSGQCTAPKTLADLISCATSEAFTDVFIFSHGWNNDWAAASARYDAFLNGYEQFRREHKLTSLPSYKPLLVGIFWPSTALVLPSEEAPTFAVQGDGATSDLSAGGASEELDALAQHLSEDERTRLYELMQSDTLSQADANELATMLAPVWSNFQQNETGDGEGDATISAEELVQLWSAQKAGDGSMRRGDSNPNYEGGMVGDSNAAGPTSAGLGDILLKPRDILRLFTVLQMKDRAGTVGAHGVGPLLRALLGIKGKGTDTPARLHLIGHSYGCIVALSALCYSADGPLPRNVESVLLLQPAVSRYCFAKTVPGESYAGGYRSALDLLERPLMTTFSSYDGPLHNFFHLAARRVRDFGQVQIALGDAPQGPSKYSALGGYGPDGCTEDEVCYTNMLLPDERYPKEPYRIVAINGGIVRDGKAMISGHGDIVGPGPWWALHNQLS